jgi:putative FmdB family regulatory protein
LPTYEYLCEACGKRYEKREGFDAPAHQKCVHCGKRANRVLYAPPIVFKGSGFYKTDSRGTSSATADSGPSTAPAADAGDSADASAPATPTTPSETSSTEAAAAG